MRRDLQDRLGQIADILIDIDLSGDPDYLLREVARAAVHLSILECRLEEGFSVETTPTR